MEIDHTILLGVLRPIFDTLADHDEAAICTLNPSCGQILASSQVRFSFPLYFYGPC